MGRLFRIITYDAPLPRTPILRKLANPSRCRWRTRSMQLHRMDARNHPAIWTGMDMRYSQPQVLRYNPPKLPSNLQELLDKSSGNSIHPRTCLGKLPSKNSATYPIPAQCSTLCIPLIKSGSMTRLCRQPPCIYLPVNITANTTTQMLITPHQ